MPHQSRGGSHERQWAADLEPPSSTQPPQLWRYRPRKGRLGPSRPVVDRTSKPGTAAKTYDHGREHGRGGMGRRAVEGAGHGHPERSARGVITRRWRELASRRLVPGPHRWLVTALVGRHELDRARGAARHASAHAALDSFSRVQHRAWAHDGGAVCGFFSLFSLFSLDSCQSKRCETVVTQAWLLLTVGQLVVLAVCWTAFRWSKRDAVQRAAAVLLPIGTVTIWVLATGG
jgi:hypothetical protein